MSTQPNNATVVHRPAARPKTKRRLPVKLILGGLAALVLGLVAVIAAVVSYALWGNPELNDRPLVLIHSPLNKEQVSEGDGVLVHATARSQAGIRRVELWADDMLIAQRDADKDASPTSMVLSADWVPTIAGAHRLVVRAISASEVDGQASTLVESIENDEPDPTGAHTVQEGETLDTIAQGYGTTAEDLAVLNPGLDPVAPPAAGSEIIVPGSDTSGEPPSEGSQPIPTDSEPPTAAGEAPALFDFLFFGELVSVPQPPAEPTRLRLDLLSLRTPQPYESLTCYIGLAGREPRRYPDADGDQSTDESFTLIRSVDKSNGGWNVADYLSGGRVPAFSWPEDQPFPLDIACVGIGGGGTQALQLGRIELVIPPDDWDGTIRQTEVIGPEGSFLLGYRIGRPPTGPYVSPKPEIDTSMTAPTNLYKQGLNLPMLVWNYEPRENEEPITGFRVNMSISSHPYADATMWIVGPDQTLPGGQYFTPYPEEWRNPACGVTYTITVTAWIQGDNAEDGFESEPSNPVIFNNGIYDCSFHFRLTFETLETSLLDGDGDYEDRSGKIGPPYGDFYVGSESRSFEVDALGGDSDAIGLNDHTIYPLDDQGFWKYRHSLSFAMADNVGAVIGFGFHIMDEDSGACEDSDDPGCDDVICEGYSTLALLYGTGRDDLYQYHGADRAFEGELFSADQRDGTTPKCKVTYRYEPMEGNPLSDSESQPPRPELTVSNILVDGATHILRFTVTNSGYVTWPHLPLEVEISDFEGVVEDVITFEDVYLEPFQSTELEYPMPDSSNFDRCVRLDPNLRASALSGFASRDRVCPEQPDLTLSSVVFDGQEQPRLQVTAQNIGDGPIVNGTIDLEIRRDGVSEDHDYHGVPYISHTSSGVSLEPLESLTLSIPIDSAQHAELLNAYTVQAHLRDQISEKDGINQNSSLRSNNWIHISGARDIFVGLCNAEVSLMRPTLSLTPYIVTGARETPGPGVTITRDEFGQDQPYRYDGCKYSSEFSIAGDQSLKISIAASFEGRDLGVEEFWHIPPYNNIGGARPGDAQPCSNYRDHGSPLVAEHEYLSGILHDIWRVQYVICSWNEP